jgi:prevent-host-death family protein
MPYTVHQAKTHFSRLIKEAEAGQEVIVMRGKKPIAKLVPLEPVAPKKPHLGGFEFLAPVDPSVFDPLTDEQMVEYGFGWMLPEHEKERDDEPVEQIGKLTATQVK